MSFLLHATPLFVFNFHSLFFLNFLFSFMIKMMPNDAQLKTALSSFSMVYDLSLTFP
ncbi:hypothetical protein GLYMA_20G167000v4 [Glycine max]|uniref:Uncharacterized protein n=1 Tax=Glycine max TaxID=3847 RepID=K7N3X0_SOYBN|nr:hypothetical protein JHK85_057471 [Glycine max]KAG5075270.1 hypothetical protein JHK84_056501 [Glycine max]KRG91654.1 hypothetical protein GLYMA_20G167000v4 [Glycine max]